MFAGTLAALVKADQIIKYLEIPDQPCLDIGLASNPCAMMVNASKPCAVNLDGNRATRPVIATGFKEFAPLTVVLNHLPSRSFEAACTESKHLTASKVAWLITENLSTRNPGAGMIVIDDFNNQPRDSLS